MPGQPADDARQEVVVENAHVERLVSPAKTGAELPQLDLDHRVGPGVSGTQPQRRTQVLADAALHHVTVQEEPQLAHLCRTQLSSREAWPTALFGAGCLGL